MPYRSSVLVPPPGTSGEGSQISITAQRAPANDRPEVIIRVRDNGIGISPELLPHVFDLFVQSTRALDRSHGGLGIGLTLVKRLVTLHGGSVTAHGGGLGHGVSLSFIFPSSVRSRSISQRNRLSSP